MILFHIPLCIPVHQYHRHPPLFHYRGVVEGGHPPPPATEYVHVGDMIQCLTIVTIFFSSIFIIKCKFNNFAINRAYFIANKSPTEDPSYTPVPILVLDIFSYTKSTQSQKHHRVITTINHIIFICFKRTNVNPISVPSLIPSLSPSKYPPEELTKVPSYRTGEILTSEPQIFSIFISFRGLKKITSSSTSFILSIALSKYPSTVMSYSPSDIPTNEPSSLPSLVPLKGPTKEPK